MGVRERGRAGGGEGGREGGGRGGRKEGRAHIPQHVRQLHRCDKPAERIHTVLPLDVRANATAKRRSVQEPRFGVHAHGPRAVTLRGESQRAHLLDDRRELILSLDERGLVTVSRPLASPLARDGVEFDVRRHLGLGGMSGLRACRGRTWHPQIGARAPRVRGAGGRAGGRALCSTKSWIGCTYHLDRGRAAAERHGARVGDRRDAAGPEGRDPREGGRRGDGGKHDGLAKHILDLSGRTTLGFSSFGF